MPEISALPSATLPYDGTEVMPIVQAGETRKASLLPYKVYTALLTQTGTDAPVATVLDNTLGETLSYTYDAQGGYIITATGTPFTTNKTAIFTGATFFSPKCFLQALSTFSSSSIYLISSDFNGILLDDLLSNTAIEIRVYY